MKIIILGSGGCVSTPKPLCRCRVCVEARAKGHPYARYGASIYVEDAALLIDTPEDIALALNHADIQRIDQIVYSHWDPDHTLGLRVMEQLRLEWLDYYEGKRPTSPLVVYAHPEVMADLNGIRSKFGSILDYYEFMGLAVRREVAGAIAFDVVTDKLHDHRSLMVGPVKMTLLRVPKEKAVSVFVLEREGKKVIYSPCDCKPYPDSELFYDADALIMGNTVIGDVLKDGRPLTTDHPLRSELHVLEDVLAMREKYRIKRLVMTHLEEDWGKGYDDYLELEKGLDNVQFAYDGMVIEI